jgi:carboxyl-terminal processing protease
MRPLLGSLLALLILPGLLSSLKTPELLGLSGGARLAAQEQSKTPPFSEALALLTFDSVWSRVANTHYDPEMGGVDWHALRDELRPSAGAATSNAELRGVLRALVGALGLSHFSVFEGALDPAAVGSGAQAGAGEGEAGVDVRWIEGALLVTAVDPEGPAARLGIAPGWAITQIDEWNPGEWLAAGFEPGGAAATSGVDDPAVRDALLTAQARARLRGEPGTTVVLGVRDAQDLVSSKTLERARSSATRVQFGNLPPIPVAVSSRVLSHDRGGEVGWIRFNAWFPVIADAVAEAVDTFRDRDGIILDLRGNPGGVGGMIMGVAGHFFESALELGEMRMRASTLRFVVNPQRVTPDGRSVTPFSGPVAILVDPLSASTSELFAAGLQAHGRARIFGERTAGQALPAVVIPLPNGDRLMHVVADYTAPGGIRLEGTGVRPDEPAPPTRAALLRGEDPALDAALRWIAAGGPMDPLTSGN